MSRLRNSKKSCLDYSHFISSFRGDNLLVYLCSDTVITFSVFKLCKKELPISEDNFSSFKWTGCSWCCLVLDDGMYLLLWQEEDSATSNEHVVCLITKELLEYITEKLIIWQAYETC